MANINKFSPTSPDTFLKQESDMALAKFGHINAIVDAYNTLDTAVTAISSTTGALKANSITEYTSGAGVTVNGALELKKTSSTTKSTAVTLTAAEVATGLIIWTGSTLTLTLPTAADLATQLNATKGTVFEFVVDNSGGSGTVTIAASASILYASAITGGTITTLANSATVGVGGWRITFISTTAAVISRLH
jgi:hypothetical protein